MTPTTPVSLPLMLQTNIIVAVAIALVALAVLVGLLFKRKQSRTTLLLLGISDAGKTSLYTLLRYGKTVQTVASMKENEGPWTVENQTFDLVDIPGHERVRFRYTDFLPVTRRIAFVVDSTNIIHQIRPVAEYLYNVLAQRQVQERAIPVLIVCNKTDMITALPVDKIQQRLEAEITRLRATRTAAVEQQESEKDEQEGYLGFEGEDFSFDHLDNPVQFEACSVAKQDIANVVEWLTEN